MNALVPAGTELAIKLATEPSPLEILFEAAKQLNHDRLAELVVRHNDDMATLTQKAKSELGVEPDVFMAWMNTKDGMDALYRLRASLDELLDNSLTTMIGIAFRAIIDRIEGGEYRRDPVSGMIYRIPMSSSSLSALFARAFGAQRIIRKRITPLPVAPDRVELEEMVGQSVDIPPPTVETRDTESMVRVMRSLAQGSSGLIIRKRSEEIEVTPIASRT